ncbi:MAG: tRNA (adenosine(37)-N6)-dimethylallyltransferase MiaA [Lachnospiraceae bacterium]|nr:tRNA (adenosine(37)-N6)-dimethylallyltransferase MiaA [Lachnospiraceae bacterium]MBR2401949.1 tRNA (adenosine(37)-N6)-dimethylallyltransferase MiaA [Lachnospiraceae bacterium]MBR3807135.1 tRNA (adenosine(37)-N6)-dimethylallyltransferase MiaA [Lachnospiraceae bacterium]MBR4061192.1 tRNA (adenosine(37)-N6)-dimethylallyltransferase MiaA [Lachnospiraceae bacterium]
MNKRKLIVLTGPTAVGKTKLSIALAKAVNGEIISADSMQVYKYMDIGSAKIKPEEMCGIKHYLVDCLDPREPESFNVTRFQQLAKDAMAEIYANGKVPILVGGTGFYIQSVVYDIDFTDNDADTGYRAMLEHMAEEKGAEFLHDMLKVVDPKAAEEIHFNNVKRVIRALEYFQQTGSPISAHNEAERQKESPYELYYFVLNDDRAKLYERIDMRVDLMLQEGLVEEVKGLIDMGCTREMVSMQGLGYKEMIDYLNGNISLEEAIYIIKRDTRHFAKRQLTWFRRERDVRWLNKSDFSSEKEILAEILEQMNITKD